MTQHMLQEATIAEQSGRGDDAIVGGLFHDIGHIVSQHRMFTMEDTSDRMHEEVGTEVLDGLFPSSITACVRYHVATKRYPCASKPEYFRRLSPASIKSLKLQGGPLSTDEVATFEQNPDLQLIVVARYLDDTGKRPNMDTPPFQHFAPIVQRVVDRHF